MAITTRAGKGSALTHSEMDANLNQIPNGANSAITDDGTNIIVAGTINGTTIVGAYGLSWNESTDTYIRTGSSEYTQIQQNMRRCVLKDDGTVHYYLNATDSSYKENGIASDLTGADGNVMVEIPKFYYKYSYTGTTHSWSISSVPFAGYSVHPAFIKGGVEVAHRYIGAYTASTDGTILKSVSGEYCDCSMTRGTMRDRARNIGTGWGIQDWNLISAVQLLMLIEFGTFKSQTAIGMGRTQLSGGSWADGSYYAINGLSNNIGNATGCVNYSGDADDAGADLAYMSYRGIEHFYGNVWSWVDGINVQDNVPYINNNPATFADDVFSGDYVSAGITMINSNGWQNTLAQVGTGFYPVSVGANDSTKISDYYWQNSGNRVVALGGNASDGSSAGAFCLYTKPASSDSYVSIGSVLAF